MTDDDASAVDFAALFEATPSPFFVLSPDLVLRAVNAAYVRITGRARDELVGRPLFEAFPSNPGDPLDDGMVALRASLDRVLRTRRPDTLPMQRYDIPDPAGGGFLERFWSAVNVPVLGPDGRVRWILHRTEDVTDMVTVRDRESVGSDEAWRQRVREVEAALFARAQELRVAQAAEARTARRLAGLADVAMGLARVQTVDELTSVVVEVGLSAMGVDGGAVAVLDPSDQMLRLAFASLDAPVRSQFQEMPVSGPLPASVVTRTGERVLLADREQSLQFSDAMREVLATTGLAAWAGLPLRAGNRVLGAITVGWQETADLTDDDVELLEAFAAQCAQALDRVQHLAREREQAQLSRQLAETLQRSLLTAPPEPDHLHVVVRYVPAAEEAKVGGDWFDAFLTPDGATSVVIGDVTGHDQHAVAAMGQIRNILRGVAFTLAEPPAAVLAALDRTLLGMGVDTLATVVLANIEQTDRDRERGVRRFRWANAGHLPPLLLLPDGSAQLLARTPNLLLGLKADAVRQDHVVELPPEATVVLYTDGLVERRGESLDVGLERLRATAEQLAGLPLDDLCDQLLERLAPVGDDDIALAAVRTYPEDEPRPAEAGPEVLPGDL